ncbi:MAG: acetyl-CoA carboxylase biotin carboxylase subunit [Planctomycetia bacterium]|nr:acetyl-CoA carboxylase biotin carboxylase subunit [Planctomycetia bacterium]
MTAPRPIRKLLVANRGEIALRVLRAAHEAGLATVAVYSDADRVELHVRAAHEAVRLGPPPPKDSYLSIDAILAAAKATGADAVHPGYGFLSENAAFREACDAAGLTFVGPSAAAMRRMGDKVSARRTAQAAGVPVVPGAELPDATNAAAVLAAADGVGFPLLVKAARGGGGKGIRRVEKKEELVEAARRAASEAKTSFGSEVVYLERYVERPRHVEVQVIVDDHGHAVAVGERECSVQRRHQKIIEETPSPVVDEALRAKVCAAGVAIAQAVGYRNAGTVELLVGADRSFYFMEMNNRLQVEHPITEMRYGVDLVAEQLRVAQGLPLTFGGKPLVSNGHAIEARVCAEDPANGFLPSTGRVTALQLPGGPGVRIDGHLYVGQEITLFYDPMLLKLIVHAPTRAQAIARMRRALHETRIGGLTTNVPLLLDVLDDARFVAGDYDTSLLNGYAPRDPAAPTAHLGDAAGEDLAPVVAAALALHRRTPASAIPTGPGAAAGESSWVREGRRSLGEWPR